MEKFSKDGHVVVRWGEGIEDGFNTSLFTYGVYNKNYSREVTDIKRVKKYVKEVYPSDILGTMEIDKYLYKKIILVGKRGWQMKK